MKITQRLKVNIGVCVFFLFASTCFSQAVPGLLPLADADSNYVKKFDRDREVRIFYGGQGNNLSLGSTRDDATKLNSDLYKNTNDYIGIGITYGWLDGDISFSLPGTTYLREERSNLTQFKLSFGFTHRKLIFRPYYSESEGVVISDSYNKFESAPSCMR